MTTGYIIRLYSLENESMNKAHQKTPMLSAGWILL